MPSAHPCRYALVATFVLFTGACRSDEDGSGGSGSTTSTASSSSTSTSSTNGSTSSSTTSSTSASTSSASASASSGTGGAPACPAFTITDGTTAECAAVGALALTTNATTECPANSSVYWPAQVYRIPVQAGDCVHLRADNAGSPMGADLFGFVLDPGGKSLLFDEEMPCAVTNPDGFKCPDGGTTIETNGDGYVFVGAWEGNGCTPMAAVPFQLSVSVNGVDVAVEPVCAGDLQQIIP